MAMRPLVCRRCRPMISQSLAAVFVDTLPVTGSQQRFLPVARFFGHGRPLRSGQPTEMSLPSRTTEDKEGSVSIHLSEAGFSALSPPPPPPPPPPPSSDPVPWYLQVDTPEPPAVPSSHHPFADRQSIPDLPEDPPSILSPMLAYLSVDAGLDDLTLLDLRSLDPPPALGANLLMVIGTARSVKHLNVSADRFCRWLRSNYKLRPYADGLLGRNELKLKLRRKARKAKLAASVGNKMYGREGTAADDGITTGWICVNVGQVEDDGGLVENVPPEVDGDGAEAGAKEQEEEEEMEYIDSEQSVESNDADYVGFGTRSNVARIVVQMLTEEKRAEIDLEKLWQDRSTRRTRKAARENEDAKVPAEEHALPVSGFSSIISGQREAQEEEGRELAAS